MQLTVNRQQLIDKLNANLSDIEQAAQAELDRLDGFRAEQRAHADALAAYFDLIAAGLRDGTIVEQNSGGLVGAMSLGGESYQLPTRPKNPNPDRDYRIENAATMISKALKAAVKARRAALALLELGTEDTVQIEAEHYEALIAETIDFHQIMVRAGLRAIDFHQTSVNFGVPA